MDVGGEKPKPAEGGTFVPGAGSDASGKAAGGSNARWMLWLIVIAPAAAIAILVTISFLSAITGVLRIILISEFIALALEPGVNWLASRGWRRGVATGVLMGGIAVVAVGVFLLIMPTVISELAGLLANLPSALAELGKRLGFDVSVGAVEQALQQGQDNLKELAANLAGNVVRLGRVPGRAGNLSVVALLSFYLTAEAPKVRRTVLELLPRKQQFEVLRLWEWLPTRSAGTSTAEP